MGDAAKATINDASPALFLAMGIFAVVFVVLFAMEIPEPHMVKEEKSGCTRYTQCFLIPSLHLGYNRYLYLCRC